MLGSLRAKFGLIATAGLLVAVVMTLLLIGLAQRSEAIVSAAQETQQHIAALLDLQNALERFRNETFLDIREESVDSAGLQVARTEFIDAMNRIRALTRVGSSLPPEVGEQLHEQAMRVVELFNRRSDLGREVDDIWEHYANQQALSRIRQAYANYYDDYYKLRELMHNQAQLENRLLEASVARAESLRHATTPVALVCLILALLGYAVVFSLVWGRLVPGLRKLESSARAFGAGAAGHPIDLDGDDELSRVSHAFDYMAEQLAQKQRSLQEFAVSQEAAVADRTRELESANQTLAAADQQRRAFLADISHELRTPLTIIRGEAQMALRQDDNRVVDPISALERILSQTRGLSRLIDDLFLIARAEAGGLVLQECELDVAALAHKVAREVSGIAEELDVRVAVQADAATWSVADPDRIRQMLMALIDNALRHARSPSRHPALEIVLSVWSKQGSTCIAVGDNGPGFAPGTLSELFLRFRRGSSATEGSGLGLGVVRALAEAMGGSVELANRPEGGGVVTMRLRAARVEEEG